MSIKLTVGSEDHQRVVPEADIHELLGDVANNSIHEVDLNTRGEATQQSETEGGVGNTNQLHGDTMET